MGQSPLFYTKNGRPVFPIMGGATDEDPFPQDTDEEKDIDEDDESTDSEAGGAGSDEGSDEDEKPKNPRDARIKELSRENAKKRNENKDLRTQLDKLQKDLKKFTDKDKSEVEKATGRVTELETEHEELKEKYSMLRLKNAFLSQSKYQFKNPALALKVVDLSEVEIDDDGEVAGLEKALDELKKSDPYLFKDAKSDEDEGDEGPPKTGDSPKRKDKVTANREALLKKYPALQR